MSPRTLLLFFSIFFLEATLSSCHSIKNIEYRNIENVQLEKLGLSNSTLNAELLCFNPNPFGLELIQSDLDIYLNDNLCGHSIQQESVKINRKQEFRVPLQLEVNMKNMLKNLAAGLLGNEVKIRVMGKLTVGKGIIKKTFPIDYSTSKKLSLF